MSKLLFQTKMFCLFSIVSLLLTTIFCDKVKKRKEDEEIEKLKVLLEMLKRRY